MWALGVSLHLGDQASFPPLSQWNAGCCLHNHNEHPSLGDSSPAGTGQVDGGRLYTDAHKLFFRYLAKVRILGRPDEYWELVNGGPKSSRG